MCAVKELGCNESDFSEVAADSIALIKRGDCEFAKKAINAMRVNVSGILIYNDGAAPDRMGLFNGNLGVQSNVPGKLLSPYVCAYSLSTYL